MKVSNLQLASSLLLITFPEARAVPWLEPVHSTRKAEGSLEPVLIPTNAPDARQRVVDLKRDVTVAPNTCGWVDGNFESAWIVVDTTLTCLWWSDIQIVNGWTTCIDYGEARSPSTLVNTCSALAPYCGSVYFPSGYRAYGNCNTMPGVTKNIELTYSGLNAAIDLPIYTGSNGVSTGTQYPPGESPAATTSAAAAGPSLVTSNTQAQQSIPGSLNTGVQQSTGHTRTNPASSLTSALPVSTPPVPTTSSSSSTPIGPIVGGVIGGLVLLCGTAVAIFWIVHRKHKEVPLATQEPVTDNKISPRFELEQPHYPAELHSQSAPIKKA